MPPSVAEANTPIMGDYGDEVGQAVLKMPLPVLKWPVALGINRARGPLWRGENHATPGLWH